MKLQNAASQTNGYVKVVKSVFYIQSMISIPYWQPSKECNSHSSNSGVLISFDL